MNIIDQLPPSVEWRVYRGDTSNFSILLYDTEDNPITLDGYAVYGQVRVKPDATSVLANLGVTINENIIVLTITDTTVLPDTSVYFDVQAYSDTSSDTRTLLKGTIIREQDVTR